MYSHESMMLSNDSNVLTNVDFNMIVCNGRPYSMHEVYCV